MLNHGLLVELFGHVGENALIAHRQALVLFPSQRYGPQDRALLEKGLSSAVSGRLAIHTLLVKIWLSLDQVDKYSFYLL